MGICVELTKGLQKNSTFGPRCPEWPSAPLWPSCPIVPLSPWKPFSPFGDEHERGVEELKNQ